MPQLMPFYWVNSVFMILYIVMTLVFFYFYKSLEEMSSSHQDKESMSLFGFKW